MKIKFCGANRFVTGSSHLIILDSGYKILLDCGLFHGKGKEIWSKNNSWEFDPKDLDCVILSHAHIDHSGRLPKLVKDGYTGPILSTHATRSLCAVMLLDSAFIQERDVEWHNKKIYKKGKEHRNKLRVPLYTSKDVGPTMDLFVGYSYDKWHRVNDQVSFILRDAGHILGSASVTLKIKEKGKETLVGFTGDIGRPERPILRDPNPMPEVDVLITESTYGDEVHEATPEQSDKLLAIIKDVVDSKGKLIIPAFSLGRTQEIVYMLDKMETARVLPKVPIYVDSPLAVNATMVFGAHPECFDNNLNEYLLIDDNPFGFNDLKYIKEVEESKALNGKKGPFVIISSSGMMNAGRVKHHLYNNIEDPDTTILIVGYCSPGTPGGLLKAGAQEIKLFGETKKLKAQVRTMHSFSAHGDQEEMYDFLSNQKKAKYTFLVHGEYETQQSFQDFLEERGFQNVHIPEQGQEYLIKI